MCFEFFIALRYLFARSGQAFITVISGFSIAGVGLGVASLIVVMGVMNGFTTDLRDKIIGMTSHAVIHSRQGKIPEDTTLLEKIRTAPGIAAATPYIHSGVLLSSHSGGSGVYLRGVDPASAAEVLGGLKKMTAGSVQDLITDEGLPGVIIGEALADRLAVHVGSRVNLLAPSGRQTTAGFTPRIKPFRVVGLFSVGLADYDASLVFTGLDQAREALGWPAKDVSGIELAVSDIDKADEIMRGVMQTLGRDDYFFSTWIEMNTNLFAALKLEKIAMAIILVLVVLVGSFSIVTALVMLVMEKTRDIAVLMSMGATTSMVRRIFMLQGLIIGCIGTGLGFTLGLSACFLLKRYRFIELPPGVYSLDYLPVLLHWQDIALTAAAAMMLCFLATLYPAHKAATLEPVEALRHE